MLKTKKLQGSKLRLTLFSIYALVLKCLVETKLAQLLKAQNIH